ncbi:hypothetical protein [Saccharomonospora sp.]|uniref:hypothetical protein n=1 Tax=Saccharomonospora sp. TaxID=33913 RepID=UPI00261CC6C5|nr:hypothetical protein [Saccharomonospora sp.]
MGFASPVGPATHARQVMEPGERLLWAAFGPEFAYDVKGLDALGEPQRNPLARGLEAVGRGGSSIALEWAFPVDEAGLAARGPDVIVFGDGPGCHAHDGVRHLAPKGGSRARTWALTSTRLVVLDVRPTKRENTGKPPTSLLRRTIGFGKELVDIVTDRTKRYGEHLEGVPVTAKPMAVHSTFQASTIAGIAVARRRTQRRTRPCLRVSFVDGSGIDLLLGVDDESVFEWMATLSRGER